MHPSPTPRFAGIPIEQSSFVGRVEEIRAARSRLGGTRLLTVLGPGGVGKTRLTIRLVKSVLRLYPDGVWFVDLSGVSSTGSVADAVGSVLDLPGAERDEAGAIAAFFGESRGILVLDNCEHVIDDCARLVARILGECPVMSVIATSRVAMRIMAEDTFVLEPFTDPVDGPHAASPAVKLFLDRSGSLLSKPTASDISDIAEITRRLDGLPLAIELAATRVRVFTPSQILKQLDDPLLLLTHGHRDSPDRQRTLRAAITWSYELCTAAQQSLWRRMSVFVQGWDLDAADAMGGAAESGFATADIVQELVEQSIIQRLSSGGRTYFRMLEAVRQFGLETSTVDELDSALEAHRDWYLHVLGQMEADWYGPNQAWWLLLARRELPNIRAALEYCLKVKAGSIAAQLLVTAWRVVWQIHVADELRRWTLRVLAIDPPETPELSQLLVVVGGIEILQGEKERGYSRLFRAEQIAERIGDTFTFATISGVRAIVSDDVSSIIPALTRSVEMQGGSNLIVARANSEELLALAHDRAGNAEVASVMRDSLVAKATLAGDRFETSYLLQQAGVFAATRGELANATELLRQSLSLKMQLDTPGGSAQIQELLASVASIGQDFTRAAMLLGIARASWQSVGIHAEAFANQLPRRAEVEARVRRRLGNRAFEQNFRRGQSLSSVDAVSYALGDTVRGADTSQDRDESTASLTPRERQVLLLVGQGLRDNEIAERLVISTRTAEGHVSKCLMKLGFTSRVELVAWLATGASSPPIR